MMLVCPDCRTVIGEFEAFTQTTNKRKAARCPLCGWKASITKGVLGAMPTKPSSLRRGYLEHYEQLAKEDLLSPMMEQEYATALNRRTALALGDVRGQSGCEVGAGKGQLAKELIGRGADVTAVDISATYLKALVGCGDMRRVQADAEFLPFEDEFDFLTCTDVMEHVLNAGNLLYCMNAALKPGGLAAIRVPADENLLLYSKHLGCGYDIVHLRSYDSSIFQRSLEGAGFEVTTLEPDGHSLSMGLPSSCDDSPKNREEVEQARALLIERGVTREEFMWMPLDFKASLSKAYVYLAIAKKTHRALPSVDQGFELKPLE